MAHVEPRTIAYSYPEFCTPETARMYRGMALREKLAKTTLLEMGFEPILPYAEWLADQGRLKVVDMVGGSKVLTEAQIKICHNQGIGDDSVFGDNLQQYSAFYKWLDADERKIIFKIQEMQDRILVCASRGEDLGDEELFFEKAQDDLRNPEAALERRQEKIINLFGLNLNKPKPTQKDLDAQRVLDVLFGSYPLDEV